MDWLLPSAEAVKTSLNASVVAAVVTWSLNGLRDRRTRSHRAADLSLRVAVALEAFAETCADGIEAHDLFERSNGAAGAEAHLHLPALPVLPDRADEGWPALPRDLNAQITDLLPAIARSQRAIDAFYDAAGDEDGALDYWRRSCAACGRDALRLGGDLRRRFRIPPAPLDDIAAFLEQEVARPPRRPDTLLFPPPVRGADGIPPTNTAPAGA